MRNAYPLNKFKYSIVFAVLSLLIGSLPAQADTRSGILSSWTVRWDLDDQQTKFADELKAKTSDRERVIENSLIAKREQMSKLFLQAMPDRKAILELQSQIDNELQEIHAIQLSYSLKIRAMLSAEQKARLGHLKLEDLVTAMDFSAAQEQQFAPAMKRYLETSLTKGKTLALLTFEQGLLLQEMDLVHGCHQQHLDVDGMFRFQKEINAINRALASERVDLVLAVHKVLQPDQLKLLTDGFSEILIPDPNQSLWDAESKDAVPPADKVFKGITISPELNSKYKEIMSREIAKISVLKKERDELISQRSKLLNKASVNEHNLKAIQDRLNDVEEKGAELRINRTVAVRNLLTPEERHTVFNRHHPKIWRDTGIDEEQDKKIMAIHMNIEDADRTGRRKSIELSQDIRKMYYDGAPDEQILSAQKAYDEVISAANLKQLNGLFEGRDVLTETQRHKLVELMMNDPQF